KTVGKGLPLPGWVIVTNRRLLFTRFDERARTEIPLDEVRVTHDEDGWLTLAWMERGRHPHAVTIRFSPKTKLLTPLVERLHVPRIDDSGRATPGRPRGRRALAPRRRPGPD